MQVRQRFTSPTSRSGEQARMTLPFLPLPVTALFSPTPPAQYRSRSHLLRQAYVPQPLHSPTTIPIHHRLSTSPETPIRHSPRGPLRVVRRQLPSRLVKWLNISCS